MEVIKAQLPTQYTGIDGVSPAFDAIGNPNRTTTLSAYVGASHTSRYKQVNMGYGNKSDFTTTNVKDKGEPNYEFEKFGSITYQLRYNKSKSTKKNDTFYSSFR